MNIKRLILLATTSLVVVCAPAGSALGASATTPPTLPTPTTAPPAPTDGSQGQITERWALTPAASADPDKAGNRSEFAYVADPGTTIADAVTVFNLGNVSEDFHVYATDAFNNDIGQFDLLTGDQKPTGVGSWVTIAQERVTVAPGKQATIPITIKVPLDAAPGDHAGAMVASSPTSGANDAGDTVQLDRRTGSRMYIRVKGALKSDVAVTRVDTTYDRSISPLRGTAHVRYRIDNRGNVRLGGTITVSVAGPFGIAETKLTVPDIPELLPGQHAIMSADVHDVPELMVGVATVRFVPTGSNAADVKASAGKDTSFVPPIPLLIAVLVLLVAILALRVYRRRRIVPAQVVTAATQQEREVEHQPV
jgi:hypothetical protein